MQRGNVQGKQSDPGVLPRALRLLFQVSSRLASDAVLPPANMLAQPEVIFLQEVADSFEPLSVMTPIEEMDRQMQNKTATLSDTVNGAGLDAANGLDGAVGDADLSEDKQVTWCHRMRSTRDHAEIPELMEVLGLDALSAPPARKSTSGSQRWSRALETRKGAGSSMAAQMSEMKANSAAAAAAGP